MNNIKNLVKSYEFEDENLLKKIVGKLSTHELVMQINNIFQEEEDSNGLLELVKDIAGCRGEWVSRKYINKFMKELNASNFRNILERKIISDKNNINLYLMSFFYYGGKSYLPILEKVYRHAYDFEPIEIPEIVKNIIFLTNRDCNWSLIENLAKSNDYLHRWSILEILEHYTYSRTKESLKTKLFFFEMLCDDVNLFVRQEAAWNLESVRLLQTFEEARPKSRSAFLNYENRMKPFLEFGNSKVLQYTFFDIKNRYYSIRRFFPEIISSRNIIEGVIAFSWKYNLALEKDCELLVKKIINYIE